MVRDPIRMKMCLMSGSIGRSSAALTIDLVLCEEDEECVPFPAGVDILQKKPKNALTGKNSAPAKFPKLSNISRIK